MTGVRTLSKRAVLVLIVGIIPSGCSDSSQTTHDSSDSAYTSESKLPAQSPAISKAFARGFHGPRDVIKEGRLTVDVMEIAAPQRAIELAQKLKQAASENPEWWLEHDKKRKPGQPLPYDSRLGLSETEFNEFLALSNQLTNQKTSEATLTITSKDEEVYILDDGQSLADLTGIEIDFENDLVRTPFGVLRERSQINANEESALGAWDGVQWKFEDLDPSGIAVTVVTLAVGKLKASGRCVFFYDVRKPARMKKREFHIS